MRRIVRVLFVVVLVAAACGDGDDKAQDPTPSTAVTTTTVPEPSSDAEPTPTAAPTPAPESTVQPSSTTGPLGEVWSVVQVDADVPNGGFEPGRRPSLMVLPDGRARVIYGTGSSLRMGTCVDVECAAVELVELLEVGPASVGEVSAALRGDGSPVVFVEALSTEDTVVGESNRLVWCDDPDCAEVFISVLPPRGRLFRPRVVAGPDGRVGVFGLVLAEAVLPPVDMSVGFTYCDDAECLTDTDALVELRFLSADDFLLVGRQVGGGFDADGIPVALHSSVPNSGVPELSVIRCDDPECASVGDPRAIATGDQGLLEALLRPPVATRDGGLVIAYQSLSEPTGGDIVVTACQDSSCADASTTIVLDNDPLVANPFDGAVGPDGLTRLVWAVPDGFVVTTCVDPSCQDRATGQLVPYRAPQIGALSAADGALLVATGEFREPSEPNIAPGVWLLRCGEPPCEPPPPP